MDCGICGILNEKFSGDRTEISSNTVWCMISKVFIEGLMWRNCLCEY
jgi:hypothetical protein